MTADEIPLRRFSHHTGGLCSYSKDESTAAVPRGRAKDVAMHELQGRLAVEFRSAVNEFLNLSLQHQCQSGCNTFGDLQEGLSIHVAIPGAAAGQGTTKHRKSIVVPRP